MHRHPIPDPAPVLAFFMFAVLAICAVLFLGNLVGMAVERLP